jgi:3',5'-cyclic AMP phosphodiesterase CpdA
VRQFPRTSSIEWDEARYRDAISAANEIAPDFVVLGGDMIDDPAQKDQLEAVLAITARPYPSIPMHWVPGNHDIAFDTVNPTPESIGFYRNAFGVNYYAFDHKGTSFIAIDTVIIDRPDRVMEEHEAQMAFLEDALRQAQATDGPTIVFGHHPPFIEDADERDQYWNLPRARRRPLLDLLAEHDVQMMFSGHRHRNDHARFGDLELVTSGAVGFPLGDDPSGYRVVDVSAAEVRHTYIGFEDQGWDE